MDKHKLPGYELRELIGRGAMGEVYRAFQASLDREVAIKILPTDLQSDPNFRDRFLTEARIVARLQHPNIVPIYDFGEADGTAYIAMALVEGKSLKNLIAGEELSFGHIDSILRQLASALDYAHSRGFVHRDVKPSNVFVTPDSRVLLMDFGIAKALQTNTELTMTGFAVGTPKYSAPEVLSGHDSDQRADLYSMGVLAFELIAGRPPFDGTEPLQVAIRHLQDPIPELSSLRPDVPLPLRQAVERLLAKQADDRFATAGDFITAAFPSEGRPADPNPAVPRRSGLLSRVWGLFRQRPKPPLPHPQSEPADDTSATPPAPQPHEGHTRSDQTFPDGTVIAPIPLPEDWPGAPSADVDENLSDRTMFVNVRPQHDDGDAPLPVAMIVIASPDPAELGQRTRLSHFPFVIGRAAEAHLVLPADAGISRQHLQIDYRDGGFHISDQSTNGTFVNGKLLCGSEANLLIGDNLKLSGSTTIRFIADVPRLSNLSGQLLDNRYELTEELYSSIKATTYIARDTRLPRSLAIKVFSPSLTAISDYHDAYQREAEVAAKLHHANIRRVVDRGEARHELDGCTRNLPYLCMELMQGGTLADRLADASPEPDLEIVTGWIRSMGDALSYAHEAGVVHGGLKPNAILFDEQDRPYLTDFAHARTGESTHGAVALGSPAYMAPEQWDGLGASEITDQYAFACLCYLMLTGNTPYEGQADPLVRARNFSRGPVPAHEQIERLVIPAAASDVLAKAMSVDPANRFPSVSAFTAELVHVIQTGKRSDGRARIFLSYRRDASAGWAVLFARELRSKHAIETFVDTERRDSAIQFPEKLAEAIADCDVFVCLLAADTLESSWVREEIRIAFEHGRPMIPVFQESYHHAPSEHEAAVDALLRYDGVHLLDRRNIHVDHTISNLAEIVHSTSAP